MYSTAERNLSKSSFSYLDDLWSPKRASTVLNEQNNPHASTTANTAAANALVSNLNNLTPEELGDRRIGGNARGGFKYLDDLNQFFKK